MKATNFNFQGAMFTFAGIETSMVLEVLFIPTGGTEYGYMVHLEGKEIARGIHPGRFSSGDAAEYALQAFTGHIRSVEGDFGGMRVIAEGQLKKAETFDERVGRLLKEKGKKHE